MKSKPLWRSPVVLAILSGVFFALMGAFDNYIVNNHITSKAVGDPIVAALVYLVAGSWIGVVVTYLCAPIFGRVLVGANYSGIAFHNRTMHKYAIRAGTFAAGFTALALWGNQLTNPGVMSALVMGTLAFSCIWDVIKKKASLKTVALPAFLVITGSLISANQGGFGADLQKTFFLLFWIVFVGANLFNTVSEYAGQGGAKASDQVSTHFWRFVYLTLTASLGALVYSSLTGQLTRFTDGFSLIPKAFPFIVGLMVCVFFWMVCKLGAMREENVSVVLIFLSVSLAINYFLVTPIAQRFFPTIFGGTSNISFVGAIGAAVVLLGVYIQANTRKNN